LFKLAAGAARSLAPMALELDERVPPLSLRPALTASRRRVRRTPTQDFAAEHWPAFALDVA